MAIIDCEWWVVRRKLLGASGGSHRGVPTIRLKPTPCNSGRPRQVRSRSIWQYCSWAWNYVLTAEERATWTTLAQTWSWTDYLGKWSDIWAFEWFMACNARAVLAGWPLHKDGTDVWWGHWVGVTDLELLTSTRIRVSWADGLTEDNRLVVFGSGPLRAGQVKTWGLEQEGRESTPRGWRWIGSSEPAAESPLEFDLPWAIESGMKLVVMCSGLDYSGMYCEDWSTAEVVAP